MYKHLRISVSVVGAPSSDAPVYIGRSGNRMWNDGQVRKRRNHFKDVDATNAIYTK